MKRLSFVLVVLLVSLIMTNSAFASVFATTTGDWNSPATWKENAVPLNDTEIKIGDCNNETVTIRSNLDLQYSPYTQKIDTGRGCTLDIVAGGKITSSKEFHVGDAGMSGEGTDDGYMNIVGGTVDVIGDHKCFVGYKATGVGVLTISSGSLTSSSGTNARMFLGAKETGADGTLVVDSSGGSPTLVQISGALYVANADSVAVKDPGTGTIVFKLSDGDGTPFKVGRAYIDPMNDEDAVAILDVNNVGGAAPTAPVLLIESTTGNAVLGKFDTLTLTGNFGLYTNLRYDYDSASQTWGTGNDIALVPEPATLVLLGIGSLLAIRRKK